MKIVFWKKPKPVLIKVHVCVIWSKYFFDQIICKSMNFTLESDQLLSLEDFAKIHATSRIRSNLVLSRFRRDPNKSKCLKWSRAVFFHSYGSSNTIFSKEIIYFLYDIDIITCKKKIVFRYFVRPSMQRTRWLSHFDGADSNVCVLYHYLLLLLVLEGMYFA